MFAQECVNFEKYIIRWYNCVEGSEEYDNSNVLAMRVSKSEGEWVMDFGWTSHVF